MPAHEDRSIGDLFRDLIANVTDLVRDEVRLARSELSEKADDVYAAALLVACAVALGAGGIAVLLIAAVAALSLTMPAWAASLIVGVAALALAAALVMAAKSKLQVRNLAPTRTVASLRGNAEFVKEKIT